MILNLDSQIQFISGVGPKMSEKLNKLGVETIRDLLFYFPRRYEDYTNITLIANLSSQLSDLAYRQAGLKTTEPFTVKGSVLGIANRKTRRRGFTVTEAVVADGSGSIKVVWFNQPFLSRLLVVGSWWILHGKVSYDSFSNGLVMESPVRANRPKIVPVYGETVGISSWFIAKLVSKIIQQVREVPEHLPLEFLNESQSPSSSKAVISSGRSPVERSSKKKEILRQALFESLRAPQSLERQDDAGRQISPTSLEARSRNGNSASFQGHNLALLPIQEAILNIHQPLNAEMLEKAQRRLAFDELFLISLQANLTNLELKKEKALPIKTDIEELKKIIAKLPFELTGDQKKALWAIIKDMEADVPMSRLLNGDVGSGKTIVAALAAWTALQAGKKTLVMCPTTILANQHYQSFIKIFDKKQIGLVTSSKKENIVAPILIGTQAFLHLKDKVEDVALVVADEQHRFGVRQRQALQELSTNSEPTVNSKLSTANSQKVRPHFLSMTATPIPRTLHLALFGDLDISVIKEKPADRQEIKTRFVESGNRDKAYEFIRDQIRSGRQAFVICPLIEEKDNVILNGSEESHQHREILRYAQDDTLFKEERKSVKAEFEKLKKIFPEFKIEMLHGKLKAKEKDEIMSRFASGKANILVSTSVVEVGVDVPNATVMVIEDAERFGLAQIHQFRGRVGRAEHQSYCFLFSSTQSEKALQRLKSLEAVSDGFELAEIDLETRGPGVIFGTEQSGLLDLKMATFSDRILIEEASQTAKAIAPEIKNHPKLLEKLNQFVTSKHLE